MLLTRSPLSPGPKAWFSLDLHVLSAPPAFVLSQDQTLREEIIRRHEAGRSDPFEPLRSMRRVLDVVFQRKKKTGSFLLAGLRLRGVSTFHAVEFSKTTPLCGNKKPLTRTRGHRDETDKSRICSLEGFLLVELQASCTLLAEGRGMVAQEILVSTKPFPAHEAPLSPSAGRSAACPPARARQPAPLVADRERRPHGLRP